MHTQHEVKNSVQNPDSSLDLVPKPPVRTRNAYPMSHNENVGVAWAIVSCAAHCIALALLHAVGLDIDVINEVMT